MYCHHFPKMDPSNALSSKFEPNAWDIANQVLHSMSRKFKLAKGYSVDLAKVSNRYTESCRGWKVAGGSPQSTVSDGDGGLHEYATLFETTHKQFGSLLSDEKGGLTHPNDMAYSRLIRLSELDHGEELTDAATSHSPVVSLKREGEGHRRNSSTAQSGVSTFTTVNAENASTPAQKDPVSTTVEAVNGTRSPYDSAATSQGPQNSQSYSDQPSQYAQTSTYGYTDSTPPFSEPTSQYGYQQTYVQSSGPSQGSGGRMYNPQRLMQLESVGAVSLRMGGDMPGFEYDPYTNMGYTFEQPEAHVDYVPHGPYMYQGQWHGQGQ